MSEGQQYAKRKIINWPQYNRSLVARGSLTLWFGDDIAEVWYQRKSGPTGRGLDKTFSDEALQICLMVRSHFGLPLRSMEGFINSVFELTGKPLRCPGYTLFSRQRGKDLQVKVPRSRPGEPMHLVVDATGLKVFGEGSEQVRAHGYSKRRTWRKLHLGVDASNHEVVAAELSAATIQDGEVLPALLDQLDEEQPVERVYADGAYDTRGCHGAVMDRQAQAVIPPRKGAAKWRDGHPRNAAVDACSPGPACRAHWKRESGYHRRSLAETAMYRFKPIIGERLRSRTFETQQVEAHVGVAVLDRLTMLGMPVRL